MPRMGGTQDAARVKASMGESAGVGWSGGDLAVSDCGDGS